MVKIDKPPSEASHCVRAAVRDIYPSALDVEFLYDGCDFLVGSDSSGDKRESQFVVDQSHAVEHGLHTSWVAIDEEEME